MRQKFSISIHAFAALAAAVVLVASPVRAEELQLKEQVTESYTVQKGDTLWGIAGKFLKEPWRWPEIWRLNKEQIKNPHRIYPGDTLRLGVPAAACHVFDAQGHALRRHYKMPQRQAA